MKTKLSILVILLTLPLFVFCQSKKEAKKNKIKSATVWKATTDNGTAVSIKESYEEYDNNGNTIFKIDYKKDGSIKTKTTLKYDKYQNKIEEEESNLKENTIIKRVFKYNANNDKTEEYEYDSTGKLLKKSIYSYDLKGLKTSKQTFNESNVIESLKKWAYEYY